jgi:preflagellin peptidase FlaK
VDAFAIARLVVGATFLSVAAFFDVRTRRVQDPLWVALGTLGLAILAIELVTTAAPANEWLLLVSAAILFYAVFYGRPLFDEDGFRHRPLRILVFAAAVAAFVAALLLPVSASTIAANAGEPDHIAQLASMPVMVLVYQGFFQIGLLRGGADAKAMIALTLLVPLYPDASPYPLLAPAPTVLQAMQVFFPYSLILLMDAAVLFLAVPLAYLVLNVVRGDLEFPQALFGTKAPVDHLPEHVWLMERVDRHGNRVVVLFPSHARDEREEVAKLQAAGATRVWVQPKVPFLVPLLLGFLLAFFVGNLILGFLTAVLPHA